MAPAVPPAPRGRFRVTGRDYGVSQAGAFGVAAAGAPALDERQVVLLMDGGSCWFELSGVSVRGMASRADAPDAAAGARLCGYVVEPRRVLAWDYAAIRET